MTIQLQFIATYRHICGTYTFSYFSYWTNHLYEETKFLFFKYSTKTLDWIIPFNLVKQIFLNQAKKVFC